VSKTSRINTVKGLEKIMNGELLMHEPMAKHTTYGIGGPALAYFYPANADDLVLILKTAHENGIPVFFAGSGSNLLVSDDGFDGFVISLAKYFRKLEFIGKQVLVESGVMMGRLVRECISRKLSGVESLIGVPGTVGGAIKMNAGAYGHEISKSLEKLKVVTVTGDLKEYDRDEIDFGYRYSSLQDDEILISSIFEFEEGIPEKIQELKSIASESRKESQPLKFRSAGSVFKNPEGANSAGYYIDQAGLKGTRSGDAEISTKHANFFVNHGGASSEDIAELIRLAKITVREQFNIELELEIKTLGFPPRYFDA
jgi:UDP-N-acetylmuramate dehydrogenase